MIYKGRSPNSVWTPLGTSLVPAVHANIVWPQPWCCVINNCFATIVCYNINPFTFAGVQITLYDDVGNVCTYTSPGLFNNTNTGLTVQQFKSCQQSGNTFKITDLWGTISFVVPNTFIAGMVLPINVLQIPPPAPPCGAGAYFSTYYVPKRNYTIYEYVQTFAVNNNYWASVYVDNYLQGAGYLGLFPNTYNPLNQINQSLPQYYTGPWSKNNALVIGPTAGYPFQCIGATELDFSGDPHQLVCGGNGTALSIYTKNTWYFTMASMGAPGNATSTDEVYSATSDVPGVYGLSLRYNVSGIGVCGVFCYDWFYEITCNFGGNWASIAGFGCCFNKNKFFIAVETSGVQRNWQFQAFSAPMSLPPTNPHIRRESYGSLANYHRAVSPDGVFQA